MFLSYRSRDRELGRDVARRLQAAGLEPVLDVEAVPAAADYRQVLRDLIGGADAVLLLITPAALESGWVMRELGMAEGLEKPVLPVTAGLGSQKLPAPLGSYQAAPYDKLDEAIAGLRDQLGRGGRSASSGARPGG